MVYPGVIVFYVLLRSQYIPGSHLCMFTRPFALFSMFNVLNLSRLEHHPFSRLDTSVPTYYLKFSFQATGPGESITHHGLTVSLMQPLRRMMPFSMIRSSPVRSDLMLPRLQTTDFCIVCWSDLIFLDGGSLSLTSWRITIWYHKRY